MTPPARRGFGSRLIEQGLAGDLGGQAHLEFEPDGLRCTIDAALAAVRAEDVVWLSGASASSSSRTRCCSR